MIHVEDHAAHCRMAREIIIIVVTRTLFLSSGIHLRISRYTRQFSSLWVTVCLNTAVYSSSYLFTLSTLLLCTRSSYIE